MTHSTLNLARNVCAIAISGRASRRAIAAAVKLCGRRLERRWPFLPKAEGQLLNLSFADLLEFQRARSRGFTALVVGAYDGVANDPASDFIRAHASKAVFVEPQPGPFKRLRASMNGNPRVQLLNAAIDGMSGSRKMYCVPGGIKSLPEWTEQLASFDRDHLLKHQDRAPGLSEHIEVLDVPTLSFDDLLNQTQITNLDVLQIDAEGMDAQLLAWFPFNRIRPALLHYEIAHMSAHDHGSVTRRLTSLGYKVVTSESPTDDMAVLF